MVNFSKRKIGMVLCAMLTLGFSFGGCVHGRRVLVDDLLKDLDREYRLFVEAQQAQQAQFAQLTQLRSDIDNHLQALNSRISEMDVTDDVREVLYEITFCAMRNGADQISDTIQDLLTPEQRNLLNDAEDIRQLVFNYSDTARMLQA